MAKNTPRVHLAPRIAQIDEWPKTHISSASQNSSLLKPTLALVVAGALAVLFLGGTASSANASPIQSWNTASSYPEALAGISCVSYQAYAYCVGGFTSSFTNTDVVVYGQLASDGIDKWSSTTGYPTPTDSGSCVAWAGYIYCVAGENANYQVNSTYYATISSAGVGQWSKTTDYPDTPIGLSCVAYSGYIYCMGGYAGYNPGDVTETFFAPLSGGGIGKWTAGAPYPITVDYSSCVVDDAANMYCVGGEQNSQPTAAVYYSHLTSSGFSAWTKATSYPFKVTGTACVTDSGSIYCVGGLDDTAYSQNKVYAAGLSAPGTLSWASVANYPVPVDTEPCVTDSGRIYCMAGASYSSNAQSNISSTYYAVLSSQGTATSTSSTVPEFPNSLLLPATLAGCLILFAVATRASPVSRQRPAS